MTTERQTERDVLRACVQGNTQAFAHLVEKYQSLVCAITYSGTGRFDTSEELAQETFLLAWRNLKQLKDLGKFRAWLCRIARSTVQNWLRRWQRDVARSAVPLEVAAGKESAAFEPAQTIVQKEQEEVVNQALQHIPEKYREPLILYYREEKSAREVAERLGLSENNARQRIARARTMLREQVAAMVETTLTRSRPGQAFTGVVMTAIAGTALKGTVTSAALAQVGGWGGWTASTLFSGAVGKAVLVAAGVAIVAGGVTWHRNRENRGTTPPSSQQPVGAEVNAVAVVNPAATPLRQTPEWGLGWDADSQASADTLPARQVPSQTVPTQALVEPQAEAQSPPVLSGSVIDLDTGDPIAGVRIQISPSGGGRVDDVVTDHRGVYAFPTVRANGTYNIRPKPKEYITRAEWERPRETVDLYQDKSMVRDFAFERGCTLNIEAVNESGRPVQGVNFFAVYTSDDMGRGPKDSVRTDANGVTSVGGLRPDEYLLVGAHRDYALVGRKLRFDRPQEVNDVRITLQEGVVIEGLATCSDDLPASAWRIEAEPIWWRSVRSWPYDDPVNEDGTFRFKHIVPGLHRLSVYIPEDGGARGIWSTEVNLPPATEFLDFSIPHPSPHGWVDLVGEVVFIGGDYDKGFWIHGQSATGIHGSVYVRNGERQFTITDLVPGLYTLDMTIHGQRQEFKNIAVPRDDLLLEITVDPQTTLSARVLDHDTGQPVTSFKIRNRAQDPWRQITDPSGLFTVSSRGYEPRQITVQAEGYSDALSPPITPDVAEPTPIRMKGFDVYTGWITNERGEPIADATVNFRYNRSRDEDPNGKFITATDAQGQFRMEVGPLRDTMKWFVFRHPDYAPVVTKLDLNEDTGSEIRMTLSAGGTVQGFAHDWRGKILKHAPVYFMDESHFPYWKENRARLGKVTTDGEGFYRIEHLPAKLCYAFIGNPMDQLGVALSTVLPLEQRTRQFDIGGLGHVSGRLLHRGEPLAHTRMRVTFEAGVAQGFTANTLTNALGEFDFFGLPTGTRGLYCSVPGDRGRDVWIKLADCKFVEGHEQVLGDFDLHLAEVRIELVFEERSRSSEHWDVSVIHYDPDGYWGRRVGELTPRMDPADPFVFAKVPTGVFEAIASCRDHPTLRRRFEVKLEEEKQSLTLTVPSGSASFSGRVVTDQPYAGKTALILRNPELTLTAHVTMDAQGLFHVGNLPAGPYIAGRAAVARGRDSVLFEMTLKPDEHRVMEIPLDSRDSGHGVDGYLIVSLVTEQGIPLATTNVWLEQGGQILSPHFNTDDSKSFMGEPGRYTLCADYPGFKPVRVPVDMKSKHERITGSMYTPLIVTVQSN